MSDATMTPDEVRAVVERLRTRIDATGQAWVPMLVNHPTSSFAASDDIRALCTAALAALDAVARVRELLGAEIKEPVAPRAAVSWYVEGYLDCRIAIRRALDAQEADRG